MATNDILQFAGSAAGADILTQVAYAADADRTAGHQLGIARRELENKALLQSSTIAAAVAQYMANSQSNNIDDSVSVATLAGYLKQAIKNVAIMFTSAAGTADAITAAFTPASTALGDGDLMVIRAASANATSTPTLAVDGLTAKTIVKGSNAALSIGDIAGAGYYLLVSYDATLDKYVLHNPYLGDGSTQRGVWHSAEVKSSGTDAGTFTSGSWVTRQLNTNYKSTIIGAGTSMGNPYGVELPPGDYIVRATAPGFNVNRHQLVLYDVTNSANLLIGTSENTTGSGSTGETMSSSRSTICGTLSLAADTEIQLRHRCDNTQASNGLGNACGFGVDEIYAELFIEQL